MITFRVLQNEPSQPSKSAYAKKSSRNIKSVTRKRKKGKTLTLAPASRSEPEHVIPSPFAPKLVVPWSLKPEPIHETEIEPQHQA